MWKIDREKKIIYPAKPLLCPFCQTQLILHDFSPLYTRRYNFFHVDIHMKCPNCSFWVTFGVPVTEADYVLLMSSPYKGKVLKDELLEMNILNSKESDLIRKRLESIGYW